MHYENRKNIHCLLACASEVDDISQYNICSELVLSTRDAFAYASCYACTYVCCNITSRFKFKKTRNCIYIRTYIAI